MARIFFKSETRTQFDFFYLFPETIVSLKGYLVVKKKNLVFQASTENYYLSTENFCLSTGKICCGGDTINALDKINALKALTTKIVLKAWGGNFLEIIWSCMENPLPHELFDDLSLYILFKFK